MSQLPIRHRTPPPRKRITGVSAKPYPPQIPRARRENLRTHIMNIYPAFQSPELAARLSISDTAIRTSSPLGKVTRFMAGMIIQIVHEFRLRIHDEHYLAWLVPPNTAIYFAISACLAVVGFEDVLEGTGVLPPRPSWRNVSMFHLQFWHSRLQARLKLSIVAKTKHDISIIAEGWYLGSGRPHRTASMRLRDTQRLFRIHKDFILSSNARTPVLEQMEDLRSQWNPYQLSSLVCLFHRHILPVVVPEALLATCADPTWSPRWDPLVALRATITATPVQEVPVAVAPLDETDAERTLRELMPSPESEQLPVTIRPGAERQFLAFDTTLIHVFAHYTIKLRAGELIKDFEALPCMENLPWKARGKTAFAVLPPEALASFNIVGGSTIRPPEVPAINAWPGHDGSGGANATNPPSSRGSSRRSSADANARGSGKLAEVVVCSHACTECGGQELTWRRAVQRVEDDIKAAKESKDDYMNGLQHVTESPIQDIDSDSYCEEVVPELKDPAPAVSRGLDNATTFNDFTHMVDLTTDDSAVTPFPFKFSTPSTTRPNLFATGEVDDLAAQALAEPPTYLDGFDTSALLDEASKVVLDPPIAPAPVSYEMPTGYSLQGGAAAVGDVDPGAPLPQFPQISGMVRGLQVQQPPLAQRLEHQQVLWQPVAQDTQQALVDQQAHQPPLFPQVSYAPPTPEAPQGPSMQFHFGGYGED